MHTSQESPYFAELSLLKLISAERSVETTSCNNSALWFNSSFIPFYLYYSQLNTFLFVLFKNFCSFLKHFSNRNSNGYSLTSMGRCDWRNAYWAKGRGSCSKVFYRIAVQKNFAKLTGKHIFSYIFLWVLYCFLWSFPGKKLFHRFAAQRLLLYIALVLKKTSVDNLVCVSFHKVTKAYLTLSNQWTGFYMIATSIMKEFRPYQTSMMEPFCKNS